MRYQLRAGHKAARGLHLFPSEPIQKCLFDVLPDDMSATGVKLLRTAAQIVGGDKALADCLGIRETILSRYMAGSFDLPDPLLLRAVDIILADRQNCGRGSAATYRTESA